MAQSKYEIRSLQVQEVLSKPPGFITLWGNTLIFSLLITVLVWVCNIQLPIHQTVPCIVLSADTLVSTSRLQMPEEKKILLMLNRESGLSAPITCTVNRIWSQEGNSYLLVSYDSAVKIARNTTGKIKLEISGAESGFEMLKRKILLR